MDDSRPRLPRSLLAVLALSAAGAALLAALLRPGEERKEPASPTAPLATAGGTREGGGGVVAAGEGEARRAVGSSSAPERDAERRVHGFLDEADADLRRRVELAFAREGRSVPVPLAADGTWSARLAEGLWHVVARHADCGRELALEPTSLVVADGDEPRVVRFAPAAILRGTLADCRENPLAEVGVSLASEGCAATSDGLGRFALPAPARPEVLVVDASTLPSGVALPYWQEESTIGAPHRIAAGATRAELFLPLSTRIEGLALGEGRPLAAGRLLSLRGRFRADVPWAEGPNLVVQIEDGGRFSVESPAPGTYEAWLFGGGAVRPDPVRFRLDCGSAEPLVLDFGAREGDRVLELVVRDPAGRPIEGLGFGLWRAQPGWSLDQRLHYPAKATMTSEEGGRAVARGLPPDRYFLVRTPSQRPQGLTYTDRDPLREIDLTAVGSASVVWVVTPMAPAGLRVVLEGGDRGVLALLLDVTTADGTHREYRLQRGRDGSFASRDLAPGEAALSVEVVTAEGTVARALGASVPLVEGTTREVTLRFQR